MFIFIVVGKIELIEVVDKGKINVIVKLVVGELVL